jgi:hypothetical protein
MQEEVSMRTLQQNPNPDVGELMNRVIRGCGAALGALWIALGTPPASAAAVDISGTLDVVLIDNGTGIFGGRTVGTPFLGFIDDVTANGQLSDGVTLVPFGCCIAASRLEVFNDEELDGESAALLNTLAGANLFSEGALIDSVNIEGDAATSAGGRIEIGVSYVFDGDTFADTLPTHYPFDPNAVKLALFFILEEDAADVAIFDAVGRLTAAPIPEPSTVALCLVGVAILSIAQARRRQRAR